MLNRKNLLDCLNTHSLHSRRSFNIKITYITNLNQDTLQHKTLKKQRFKSLCYFIKSASFLNYFPKEKPIQSMRAQLSSVMKLQLCTSNIILSIFQLVKKQQNK